MTQTSTVTPLGKPRVVALSSVKPYGRNPRRIPAKAIEQTAKSIREFGWQQPIVVDADMVIIAGHVRHAAATSLGLAEVPVIVADKLSPAQVRAYRVADNRTQDYTTWDYTTLVEELGGLGEEFTDVLDLADWSSLMMAFETEYQAGSSAGSPSGTSPSVGTQTLPEEPDGTPIAGTGFLVRVEFASREDADRAGPSLMKIAGVINVRYPVQ